MSSIHNLASSAMSWVVRYYYIKDFSRSFMDRNKNSYAFLQRSTRLGASYRVRTVRHMLQAMDCMLGISKIPPTQYSPQAVLHIYAIVVNFEDLIGMY